MKASILGLLLLAGIPAMAQPNQPAHASPYNFPGVQYPRIEADNRVSFRMNAPSAQKVQVSIANVAYDMVKGDGGAWTYTSAPQDPGYHNYWMVVDGAVVLDPGTAASIGLPNRSHVSAAKAALGGLARSLAAELADRRITVNCVSPGLIDTAGTATSGSLTPAMQQLRIVANRLGRPEEIAAMVALVVSEDGAYITGQVLHVNGGMYFGQ
jgi:NAD(P)-dependent dehydrogenase (short-subunit alcohol dehydrogenase family)